jgi:hypothetical protein
MGMFDSFVPDPPLLCRHCGAALSGFQGKDGPCWLFVWREGRPAPVGQEGDEQRLASAIAREAARLPATFCIYASCSRCHDPHVFTCRTIDGVWRETIFGEHAPEARPVAARDMSAGMRQCSGCAECWEWEPTRLLAGCPSCGALTRLQTV